MNRREGDLVYQRLRTPQQHGRALIEPRMSTLVQWAQENASRPTADFDILGTGAKELRDSARRELYFQAPASAATTCEESSADKDRPEKNGAEDSAAAPLIMSGHQPDLFHPGVWFKNFALNQVAQQSGGWAVNMNVDNDLCRLPAIRCPRLRNDEFSVESTHFDAFQQGAAKGQTPFEDRTIEDMELFRSFADRTLEILDGAVEQPIIERLWPLAVEASRDSHNLGNVIAKARSKLERSLGVANRETTVSRISNSRCFRRFGLHLLVHAAEFLRMHNAALASYRRVNRVRSKAHPAPALETLVDWVETPLWIWSASDPVRRRAFVRSRAGGLQFGAPEQLEISLPDPQREPDSAIDALAEAEDRGIRVRPRALTTTMYARLFLCDLFIHGVGGAKYDQLTDELLRRFWQIQAPPFATLTATALLPLSWRKADPAGLDSLTKRQRELLFHAEKHIQNPNANAIDWMREKRDLITHNAAPGEGKPRQQRLLELNRRLSDLLQPQRTACRKQRADLLAQLRIDRLVASREYSFCLHSWPTLPQLLLDLCGKQP